MAEGLIYGEQKVVPPSRDTSSFRVRVKRVYMYIRSPRSCTSVQLVGNAYFRAAFYRVVERGFENFFLPRCRGTISRTLRARNPAREISALFPLFCVFSTFFFFFF